VLGEKNRQPLLAVRFVRYRTSYSIPGVSPFRERRLSTVSCPAFSLAVAVVFSAHPSPNVNVRWGWATTTGLMCLQRWRGPA